MALDTLGQAQPLFLLLGMEHDRLNPRQISSAFVRMIMRSARRCEAGGTIRLLARGQTWIAGTYPKLKS